MTIGSSIARRVLERFPLPRDNGFLNQFFNLLHGAKPEPGPLTSFVVERIWETDQSVMAQRLAQLESFDVSERLWKIDTPTLVLAGSKDAIVPAARQKLLAQSIPGARLEVLEGAGHIGFLTHRREIARQVQRHLLGPRPPSDRTAGRGSRRRLLHRASSPPIILRMSPLRLIRPSGGELLFPATRDASLVTTPTFELSR